MAVRFLRLLWAAVRAGLVAADPATAVAPGRLPPALGTRS
jgi:hypothetical protein